jgi:hypothetical protein
MYIFHPREIGSKGGMEREKEGEGEAKLRRKE